MASTVSMCWTVEPPLMAGNFGAQMSSIAGRRSCLKEYEEVKLCSLSSQYGIVQD